MAATLAELEITTGTDRMNHWQFIKAILEFKYGDLTKEEAIDTMAYYTGLDPFFCNIMLREMCKEHMKTLMISWPNVGDPPPPYYPLPRKVHDTSPES